MRDQIGIALAQFDQLVRQPEPVGEDLRKRRLVPLADMLGPGDQRYRTVRLKADVDILRRFPAGPLDVVREPEAAQLPACFARPSPRRETADVGARQRALE